MTSCQNYGPFMGTQIIRGRIYGTQTWDQVPITKTIVFWGLYWDPEFGGSYQVYLPHKNGGSLLKLSQMQVVLIKVSLPRASK